MAEKKVNERSVTVSSKVNCPFSTALAKNCTSLWQVRIVPLNHQCKLIYKFLWEIFSSISNHFKHTLSPVTLPGQDIWHFSGFFPLVMALKVPFLSIAVTVHIFM